MLTRLDKSRVSMDALSLQTHGHTKMKKLVTVRPDKLHASDPAGVGAM
jgi:hypothetical protein